MGILWRSRMNEKEIDDAYVNGFNNAIDELMDVVGRWQESATAEFTRDAQNNAWVALLPLAKLADELKW